MTDCEHPFFDRPLTKEDKERDYVYSQVCPDCGKLLNFVGYKLAMELRDIMWKGYPRGAY